MESGLSASDIALLGNGDGLGNNAFMWIFALLILAGGGFGGMGFGKNGGFNEYATAASQQEILFGQQFQGLDNKLDRLGNGIADATFSLNNSITNEGRNIQTQIADCCCSTKEALAQVRYDMANFTAQTQTAIHAEGEATRNMLQQNKIEALQAQVSQLQLNQAMCGVVRYPNQMVYTAPYNCNCTPATV